MSSVTYVLVYYVKSNLFAHNIRFFTYIKLLCIIITLTYFYVSIVSVELLLKYYLKIHKFSQKSLFFFKNLFYIYTYYLL